MLVKLMIAQKMYKESMLVIMSQVKLEVRLNSKVVTDQFKANIAEASTVINNYELVEFSSFTSAGHFGASRNIFHVLDSIFQSIVTITSELSLPSV